jgi:hypothetical protein
VAEAVGRGLNCAQTVVCDATHDAVSVAAERGDAAVFAVPVYGGHAAPLALRRLDAVRGDGTPAVVVVLYGNRAYEHAACELADFVAARGFVPVAAAAFVGEHSYSTARWPWWSCSASACTAAAIPVRRRTRRRNPWPSM